MFTVKYCGADNVEFAIECASFKWEPIEGKPGCFRLMTYDEKHSSGPQTMLWAGDVRDGPGIPDVCYVMNSDGATISKYAFRPIDWGEDVSLAA